MEELRFQSPAKPEDVVDGRDFRSGFVEADDLPAIAAVWGHTHQSAPTHRPEGSGGEAGRRGTGGSMAWHDRLHCSEGTPQGDIQDPLDSVDQGSDDVGAESVAARTARRSAPQDSPGWDKSPQPAFERQHSRKGWTGGNHWLNTDSVPGCRHRGRLDNLQALPVDCTEAGRLIPRGRDSHSVPWNETGGTSSATGSLDTEEHPWCYSSFR